MILDEIQKRLEVPVTLSELSEDLSISQGAILDLALSLGAELSDPYLYLGSRPSSIIGNLQKEVTSLRTKLQTNTKLVKDLTEELKLCEERNFLTGSLADNPPPVHHLPRMIETKGTATAVLLASDWHVGERVDSHSVCGLNEYSPDIARLRAQNFFNNSLSLIEKERSQRDIDDCVLWLGGDLITGYIHEELEESNHLSPTEEIILCQELIESGLNLIKSEVQNVTVVCNYGNHGRTGKKKRISTGAKNSYEWLLYQHMANRRADVNWHVSSGYFAYLNVYDFLLRFHHGDGIKYQGGIGGVTVPLIKFVGRANTQRRATLDIVGHFHTLTFHSSFVVNGSLIGVTPYSVSSGFPYERPQQGFLLIDAEHGVVSQAPILV
jgi:hypothetical protein